MIKYLTIGVKKGLDQDKKFKRGRSISGSVFFELGRTSILITLIIMFLFGELMLGEDRISKHKTAPYFFGISCGVQGVLYLIYNKKLRKAVQDYKGPLSREEFKPYIYYLVFWGILLSLSIVGDWFDVYKLFIIE